MGERTVPALSILIPTRGRPAKLRACIKGLLAQDVAPGSFEILIGVDGDSSSEAEHVEDVIEAHIQRFGGTRVPCRVFELARGGPAATRNTLLSHARGSTVLLLNDDVVPQAACVRTHIESQRELAGAGKVAMVLGAAPWKVHEPDRLFDRLIRETSMVFFYDQMVGSAAADPNHDWGFRHAWTLNLSMPTRALRDAGGFDATLPAACYEDLECAWRVNKKFQAPVLFRPGAVVLHDHRYEPLDYLAREVRLGHDALVLAHSAAECAMEIFRRDVAGPEEVEKCVKDVERDGPHARGLARSFLALADAPAGLVRERTTATSGIGAIYQHHLPLKRWLWKVGLAASAEGRGVESIDVRELLGLPLGVGSGPGVGRGAFVPSAA